LSQCQIHQSLRWRTVCKVFKSVFVSYACGSLTPWLVKEGTPQIQPPITPMAYCLQLAPFKSQPYRRHNNEWRVYWSNRSETSPYKWHCITVSDAVTATSTFNLQYATINQQDQWHPIKGLVANDGTDWIASRVAFKFDMKAIEKDLHDRGVEYNRRKQSRNQIWFRLVCKIHEQATQQTATAAWPPGVNQGFKFFVCTANHTLVVLEEQHKFVHRLERVADNAFGVDWLYWV
jgi:hypothetical protein